jgi:hypothetical protein
LVAGLANLIGCVMQERHEARTLYMLGYNALMQGAVAGVAASQNLATVADKTLQLRCAFVIYAQRSVATKLALFRFFWFKRTSRPRIGSHRSKLHFQNV